MCHNCKRPATLARTRLCKTALTHRQCIHQSVAYRDTPSCRPRYLAARGSATSTCRVRTPSWTTAKWRTPCLHLHPRSRSRSKGGSNPALRHRRARLARHRGREAAAAGLPLGTSLSVPIHPATNARASGHLLRQLQMSAHPLFLVSQSWWSYLRPFGIAPILLFT